MSARKETGGMSLLRLMIDLVKEEEGKRVKSMWEDPGRSRSSSPERSLLPKENFPFFWPTGSEDGHHRLTEVQVVS